MATKESTLRNQLDSPQFQAKLKREKYKQERKGYSCTRIKAHPIYDAWRNMKRRCYYKNSGYYQNYGGRGICVCAEWREDYNVFLAWALDHNWKEGLTLDRINNDGMYQPSNCRWITQSEQLLNRRNNHIIEYNGEIKTLKEWSDALNINFQTLAKRLHNWGMPRAFEEPIDKSKIRKRGGA